MQKLLLIILAFITVNCFSQVTEGSLVNIHSITNAEMLALVPESGSLAFNTTDNSLYVYNGTSWEKNNKTNRTYVGHFIISGTGNQTIAGLPFKPSSITFSAFANIETININSDNDTNNNNNGISNSFQSMTGYARDNGGSISQQVIGVGGSGNSINDISRYSNPTQCIGIRYGNQNGDNLGITSASLTSFNTNGFTINVNSRADNLVVIYTAYE